MIKYELINQLPYCCVPACIQMILRANKVKFALTQKEIAYSLGLTVPTKFKKLFPLANISNKESDFGIKPQIEDFSLNHFFQNHSLPFQEFFNLPSDILFGEYLDFIEDNLKQNNDIIAGVSYGVLQNETEYKDVRHAILIEKISTSGLTVVIPDENNTFRKEIPLSLLIEAIKFVHDGFWVIKKKI